MADIVGIAEQCLRNALAAGLWDMDEYNAMAPQQGAINASAAQNADEVSELLTSRRLGQQAQCRRTRSYQVLKGGDGMPA